MNSIIIFVGDEYIEIEIFNGNKLWVQHAIASFPEDLVVLDEINGVLEDTIISGFMDNIATTYCGRVLQFSAVNLTVYPFEPARPHFCVGCAAQDIVSVRKAMVSI